MLELPNRGLRRSTTRHNSWLESFCDWLEANVLFEEDDLALAEVVDRLIEEQIYDDQDFAWEFVDNASAVLRGRAATLQRAYPVTVGTRRLIYPDFQPNIIPYNFCLLLSVLPLFAGSNKKLGSDRSSQGQLLEKLAENSLRVHLPGWSIDRTGWSASRAKLLSEVAKDVAQKIDASVGNPEMFSGGYSKEAGLDILCFKPFPDRRGGYPCIMVQCASGAATWKKKRNEPDLRVWGRAVTFDNSPSRALVIPFAISHEELCDSSVRVDGLVLDRVRLLLPGRDTVGLGCHKNLKQSCQAGVRHIRGSCPG